MIHLYPQLPQNPFLFKATYHFVKFYLVEKGWLLPYNHLTRQPLTSMLSWTLKLNPQARPPPHLPGSSLRSTCRSNQTEPSNFCSAGRHQCQYLSLVTGKHNLFLVSFTLEMHGYRSANIFNLHLGFVLFPPPWRQLGVSVVLLYSSSPHKGILM